MRTAREYVLLTVGKAPNTRVLAHHLPALPRGHGQTADPRAAAHSGRCSHRDGNPIILEQDMARPEGDYCAALIASPRHDPARHPLQ